MFARIFAALRAALSTPFTLALGRAKAAYHYCGDTWSQWWNDWVYEGDGSPFEPFGVLAAGVSQAASKVGAEVTTAMTDLVNDVRRVGDPVVDAAMVPVRYTAGAAKHVGQDLAGAAVFTGKVGLATALLPLAVAEAALTRPAPQQQPAQPEPSSAERAIDRLIELELLKSGLAAQQPEPDSEPEDDSDAEVLPGFGF